MKYNSIKSKFLIAILLIIAISSSLFANSKMSDPGQGLPFLWKSINVLHMANDFNNIAAPPAPPPSASLRDRGYRSRGQYCDRISGDG